MWLNAVFIAMIGSLNSNANMQETSLHEFSCNTEVCHGKMPQTHTPVNNYALKSGGHYTSFVAMCHLLLSIIT